MPRKLVYHTLRRRHLAERVMLSFCTAISGHTGIHHINENGVRNNGSTPLVQSHPEDLPVGVHQPLQLRARAGVLIAD